jgi:hypothetical protein
MRRGNSLAAYRIRAGSRAHAVRYVLREFEGVVRDVHEEEKDAKVGPR